MLVQSKGDWVFDIYLVQIKDFQIGICWFPLSTLHLTARVYITLCLIGLKMYPNSRSMIVFFQLTSTCTLWLTCSTLTIRHGVTVLFNEMFENIATTCYRPEHALCYLLLDVKYPYVNQFKSINSKKKTYKKYKAKQSYSLKEGRKIPEGVKLINRKINWQRNGLKWKGQTDKE